MHFGKNFVGLSKLKFSDSCKTSRLVKSLAFVRRASSNNKSTSIEAEEPQTYSLAEEKKEMKGPFIKNIFCGIFDSSVLEYPEYPSMEYVREIKRVIDPIEEYFLNCVDSKGIDEKQEIPSDITLSLRENNFFSLLVPQKWGGLELDHRCYSRYCESVGSDMSISTFLEVHNNVVDAILLHGNESLKEKYLPKLISGESAIGFCLLEKPNIFDAGDIDTFAIPDDNGDWVINGKKIWVANGCKADSYLVFAKTWSGTIKKVDPLLSVFLVDKSIPGVQCGQPIEQLGTRGIEICDVSFNNVVVKKENVLGELGTGVEIAFQSVSGGRLGAAASAVGFLKNLLSSVTEYAVNTKVSGKPLYSYEYTQRQLGMMAADLYALESMVYLTAGIKDTYSNPDILIEESIVKIFSMEKIVEIVDRCADVIGGSAYIKGLPFEKFIRDSRSYLLHDVVPLHVSKIFIASLGLQHSGIHLKDYVIKNRNPFDFPGFVLKTMWNEKSVLDDDVKIPGLLKLQLHPSLSNDADKLEASVIRFEAVVKNLLRRWGSEIIDRQMDLTRLADCVVSMYAMTAVLGRASRSYCIGLHNSDFDMATANVLCSFHHNKIKETIESLFEGPVDTNDGLFFKIGEKVALSKGYFYEHPLARNY